MLDIRDWEWDAEDGNLDELAAHGLDENIVEDVWQEAPIARRNKGNRAASHQIIGPDRGGKLWTICIVEKHGWPGTWRAVTGWEASSTEETWYRQRKGKK